MCRYRNRRHKCPNCEYIWDNPESEELCVKKVKNIFKDFFPLLNILKG